ncbi:Mitochondrial distribution and morphology protein 31, mitochondrial precursor [Sorochytrium milnesiophthora]
MTPQTLPAVIEPRRSLRTRLRAALTRTHRPWTLDDLLAMFSWLFVGNALFILLGTTTAVSVALWVANSLNFHDLVAYAIGKYLTQSTGTTVIFDAAILPNWKDGKISLANVSVSRKLALDESRLTPHPYYEDDLLPVAHAEPESLPPTASLRQANNFTKYDITIKSIDITLSLVHWLDGKGLIKDAIVKGVRGTVDRRDVFWDASMPDTPRRTYQVGDFELEHFVIEDMFVTVLNPLPAAAAAPSAAPALIDSSKTAVIPSYTVSIFSARLPRFRKQWLLYDIICADSIVGMFDDCLFNLHAPQQDFRFSYGTQYGERDVLPESPVSMMQRVETAPLVADETRLGRSNAADAEAADDDDNDDDETVWEHFWRSMVTKGRWNQRKHGISTPAPEREATFGLGSRRKRRERQRTTRLKIDGVPIAHMNAGAHGPFGWINRGTVDLTAVIHIPDEWQWRRQQEQLHELQKQHRIDQRARQNRRHDVQHEHDHERDPVTGQQEAVQWRPDVSQDATSEQMDASIVYHPTHQPFVPPHVGRRRRLPPELMFDTNADIVDALITEFAAIKSSALSKIDEVVDDVKSTIRIPSTPPRAPRPQLPQQRPLAMYEQQTHDLVMDLTVTFNNVRASVPLAADELGYLTNAFIRPVVAYMNAHRTSVPVHCRAVLPLGQFDGAWTIYQAGLVDVLAAEVGKSIVTQYLQDRDRARRIRKIGLWSVQAIAKQVVYLWGQYVQGLGGGGGGYGYGTGFAGFAPGLTSGWGWGPPPPHTSTLSAYSSPRNNHQQHARADTPAFSAMRYPAEALAV